MKRVKMKTLEFEEVSKVELEKEAFDKKTNSRWALLLQDLLKGAERVSKNLSSYEALVFLKQRGGNIVKFEIVRPKST